MILATYCITQWKKRRGSDRRDSVIINPNQNTEKAANLYFRDPTGRQGAFSKHQGKRPLPRIPPNKNKAQCLNKDDKTKDDINEILRKQSIAIPASFSDPLFNQNTSNECEASLPGLSLRPNRSEGALSSRTVCHSIQENDVIGVGNNDFIAMKPIQCKFNHNSNISVQMYFKMFTAIRYSQY